MIYDVTVTYTDDDFLPRPLAAFLTPPPRVRADAFNATLCGFSCTVLLSSSLSLSSAITVCVLPW